MPVTATTSNLLNLGAPYSPALVSPVSGADTSGNVALSGSYAGPWFIMEQGLIINYHRIPYAELSSTVMSLSSSTIGYRNTQSVLACEVIAWHSGKKDWSRYSTSAAVQPQTFQILAVSSDTRGNSYGALTASDLGPMGTIVTKTPYYFREPWNDLSGHYEAEQQCTGATYFSYGPSGGTPGETGMVRQTAYNDDWDQSWVPRPNRGTLLSEQNVRSEYDLVYSIPGQYATSKESVWMLTNVINQLGQATTYSLLYSVPGVWNAEKTWAEHNTGCSKYYVGAHQY